MTIESSAPDSSSMPRVCPAGGCSFFRFGVSSQIALALRLTAAAVVHFVPYELKLIGGTNSHGCFRRGALQSHDFKMRSGSPMRTDGRDTYCFGPSSSSETQTHQMPARRGTGARASGKRGRRRAGGGTARAERGRAADVVEPLRRPEEGLRVRRAERHEQPGLQVWGCDAQRRPGRGQRDQRRHWKRHVRPGVPHSHDMEQTSTAHAGTSSAT